MESLQAVVDLAREKAGSGRKLADALGLTRQAVYQWKKVPPEHVLKVEELTGIPRSQLRPDLYPENRELLHERLSS